MPRKKTTEKKTKKSKEPTTQWYEVERNWWEDTDIGAIAKMMLFIHVWGEKNMEFSPIKDTGIIGPYTYQIAEDNGEPYIILQNLHKYRRWKTDPVAIMERKIPLTSCIKSLRQWPFLIKYEVRFNNRHIRKPIKVPDTKDEKIVFDPEVEELSLGDRLLQNPPENNFIEWESELRGLDLIKDGDEEDDGSGD